MLNENSAERAIALHTNASRLVLNLSKLIDMHTSYASMLLIAASRSQITASNAGRLAGYTLTGAKRSMLALAEAGYLDKTEKESGRIVGFTLTDEGRYAIARAYEGETK